MRLLILAFSFLLALGTSKAFSSNVAIVLQDHTPLRPAPKASTRASTVLWQGEIVELRGEKLDYVQVWNHGRERGGYVRSSQVARLELDPGDAPALLAVLRFLRDRPGSEALGMGYAAAFIEAAPAEMLKSAEGMEAFDALGMLAERLARRASIGTADKQAQAALAGHLEVAGRYGVRFATQEHGGRMRLCYEGAAFRRVLALSGHAEQRARAALALTEPQCVPAGLRPAERRQLDEWRAEVLDQVEEGALRGHVRNRVLMRRAAVWAAVAFQRARLDEGSEPGDARAPQAVAHALKALGAIDKAELAEEDLAAYNEAAVRANASRWAGAPAKPAPKNRPYITTSPGEPGQTCVALMDGAQSGIQPAARRCTYSQVWTASASLNREGSALSVAVQPAEGWRELWVFHKGAKGWTVKVLPPAATSPEAGYAELKSWVPGGRTMVVSREAIDNGKLIRAVETVRVDTLAKVAMR